ncbi:MAG: c-type cytochrome [Verrucomicrobiales bacterium]
MKKRLLMFAVVASCLAGSQPAAFAAEKPEWIWHDNKGKTPADGEVSYFRKSFKIDGKVSKAELSAACDDQATLYLNGKEVLKSPNWNKAVRANVTRELKSGDNVLAVMAKNNAGDAGLVVKLDVTLENGKKFSLYSDRSWVASLKESKEWQTASADQSAFTQATSKGQLGVQPWGDVMTPAVATPAESLTVAKGFKAELLRSSDNEGSWVAMTTDPKGRLIVSPQEGRGNMLRITLDDKGQVANMETIDLPIGGAMGLLYAFDSLYVSGGGPDGLALYRLKDTDNNDQYDKVELLKKFEGAGGEHGSHALEVGPDNKIYYMHGNFVKVPSDISPNSPHSNYAEDTLLPRGEDGNGFGVGIKPPGGFIVRGDKDGKNWEMVAAGMRNAYDFDFNLDGEMFTYDSDMEWDWGMPWYRATRIYHLVSGGDYGFREGTAKYPEYYPDSLPPTLDIGIGSPTGVKFGTGAKFPAKYQRAMYAMDWSYGRIFAVHLTPDGASYKATAENFVKGKPLNVTDMEIGKDGSLYFITGGRGTQSGLYRVSYAGNDSTELVKAGDQQSKTAQARALRKKLEAFHGKKDAAAVDLAMQHIGSSDRWIRNAARVALESQPVDSWKSRIEDLSNPDAIITATTALARTGSPQDQGKLFEALGKLESDSLNVEQKLAALRVISLSFIRMGKPGDKLAESVIEALGPINPAEDVRLNRELSQVLIYLGAPGVVQQTLELAKNAETVEDQIHYMFHLRTAKNGWTKADREYYFNWFNQNFDQGTHPEQLIQWFKEADSDYRNGASFPKFIANIRGDAVAGLSEQAKTALAPIIAGKAKAAEPTTVEREFVKEWTMEDLTGSIDAVSSNRSFQKGKAAFAAAQCLACHRFGNEGGAVGPDITTISSRFARRDLLESIIDPSKVISEQYSNTTLYLKDDEEITGRILEEKPDSYVVMVNPLLNTKQEVKKADVTRKEIAKFSAMPAGLVNVLTKDEIYDLLAYIEAGGKQNAAQFQKKK